VTRVERLDGRSGSGRLASALALDTN
jgi:hypothetical protein